MNNRKLILFLCLLMAIPTLLKNHFYPSKEKEHETSVTQEETEYDLAVVSMAKSISFKSFEVFQNKTVKPTELPPEQQDSNKMNYSFEYLTHVPELTPKPSSPPKEKKKSYTKEDLYYLSRIIWAEAGSDWCSDEHQLAVGSVVLNRVASDQFPNTIKKVVTQRSSKGPQYTSYNNKNWRKGPNQRAIDCAIYLLEHGSTIPSYVIFQSQGKQGNGVWKKIQNQYFCYNEKE